MGGLQSHLKNLKTLDNYQIELKTIVALVNCFSKTFKKELDIDKIVSKSIEDLVENNIDMGENMMFYIGYRILDEILGENFSECNFPYTSVLVKNNEISFNAEDLGLDGLNKQDKNRILGEISYWKSVITQ